MRQRPFLERLGAAVREEDLRPGPLRCYVLALGGREKRFEVPDGPPLRTCRGRRRPAPAIQRPGWRPGGDPS